MDEKIRPPSRKPYQAPRVQDQGKVVNVTRQVTPTPGPTPTGSSSGLSQFDEF
mgnify:CR=1 FL=1